MKKYKKIVHIITLDKRRFKLLYIFNLLMILCLFGRLVNLQVFNASDLQRKARLIQSSTTSSLKKGDQLLTEIIDSLLTINHFISYGLIQDILIFLVIQLKKFVALKKLKKNYHLFWR